MIDDCELEKTLFRVNRGECYRKNQFNILGYVFISDNIILFYTNHLIRKGEESNIHCRFLNSTFYELFCADCDFSITLNLQNSSLWLMIINYNNLH